MYFVLTVEKRGRTAQARVNFITYHVSHIRLKTRTHTHTHTHTRQYIHTDTDTIKRNSIKMCEIFDTTVHDFLKIVYCLIMTKLTVLLIIEIHEIHENHEIHMTKNRNPRNPA